MSQDKLALALGGTPAPKPEPDGWVCVGPDGEPYWSTVRPDRAQSERAAISWEHAGWRCLPVVVQKDQA